MSARSPLGHRGPEAPFTQGWDEGRPGRSDSSSSEGGAQIILQDKKVREGQPGRRISTCEAGDRGCLS